MEYDFGLQARILEGMGQTSVELEQFQVEILEMELVAVQKGQPWIWTVGQLIEVVVEMNVAGDYCKSAEGRMD